MLPGNKLLTGCLFAGVALLALLLFLNRKPSVSLSRFPSALQSFLSSKKQKLSKERHRFSKQRMLSFHRGIALGLYSKNSHFDYGPLLKEIKEHQANRVSLFFSLYQESQSSVSINPNIAVRAQEAMLRRTIRQARRLGLQVMLFPIVLLEKTKGKQWRGNIKPHNHLLWFQNYQRELSRLAALAQQEGVESFCIGSEFSSMERYGEQWTSLIKRIRKIFSGLLVYSANWDHYRNISFWHKLDVIGISGYFKISSTPNPTLKVLLNQWHWIRNRLLIWKRKKHLSQPIMFTELGYPNIQGASMEPWNYTRIVQPSLYEQALCYESFIRTWYSTEGLGGVYFYNWFGYPFHSDTGYSPRGKPAALLIQAWYAHLRQQAVKYGE